MLKHQPRFNAKVRKKYPATKAFLTLQKGTERTEMPALNRSEVLTARAARKEAQREERQRITQVRTTAHATRVRRIRAARRSHG